MNYFIITKSCSAFQYDSGLSGFFPKYSEILFFLPGQDFKHIGRFRRQFGSKAVVDAVKFL